MEEYTIEEEKAMAELRVRLQDVLPKEFYDDEVFLYKFLKARKFNLKHTESMIIKHLHYRKVAQLDTHLKDHKPREVLMKYISQDIFGFNKDGYPVHYISMGTIDGRGLYNSVNADCVLKHVIVQLELDKEVCKKQTKKLGKLICHSIFIFNMDKLSLAQATHKSSIQNFARCVQVFQDNYPELLKRLYIINAQLYFTMAYALVKPVLAPVLVDKIRIYGRTGWKEELLKEIDADVLPAFLGGNRTDPDGNPLCLSVINHAETVPESYYLEKNIEKISNKAGIKYIRIDRQSVRFIDIEVEQYSSIINWEFEVVNHDIGFGLIKETTGDKIPEELIPVHKVETELEPTCGMYRCKEPGKYTIIFDNSYSWIHYKEVYYDLWISDSKDAEEYLALKVLPLKFL